MTAVGNSVTVLRKVTSTPFILDQYLPEFWERAVHPYLGNMGTIRYRLLNQTISSISLLRLRFGADRSTNFPSLLEQRFRALNGALISGQVPKADLLRNVTEPLCEDLPLRNNRVPEGSPLFRLLKINQPRLVQSRFFHLPTPNKDERIRFAQITLRVVSEQSPVKNRDNFPVDPVPFEQRRVWLPAARPKDGRVYYFDPKSKDTTYRPKSERFSRLPLLDRSRGTFGNTGRVVDINIEKNVFQVENYLVMERRLSAPETQWRIHHF